MEHRTGVWNEAPRRNPLRALPPAPGPPCPSARRRLSSLYLHIAFPACAHLRARIFPVGCQPPLALMALTGPASRAATFSGQGQDASFLGERGSTPSSSLSGRHTAVPHRLVGLVPRTGLLSSVWVSPTTALFGFQSASLGLLENTWIVSNLMSLFSYNPENHFQKESVWHNRTRTWLPPAASEPAPAGHSRAHQHRARVPLCGPRVSAGPGAQEGRRDGDAQEHGGPGRGALGSGAGTRLHGWGTAHSDKLSTELAAGCLC